MSELGAQVKKDFFISYNKSDRPWAEWIAWHLEETGLYSIIIQVWDFGAGCNFVVEMDRAAQECERIVAVLSPDYLASLFTRPEWAAYFGQDPASERHLIVPVRVRECELKGLLAPIVYVNMVGLPEGDAAAALLEGVKFGRRKPKIAPGFPGRPPRVIHSAPRFPGTLPPVWNVPHPRNPIFSEPGTSLADLRSALLTGKSAALTRAFTGLGGVGKTQLANEYAWRHASDYGLVWWLRAEEPAALAADYATLATELDLPEKQAADQPAAIAAVRKALRLRADWLLIFDNAETWNDLDPFLPGSAGHVLITSRNPDWVNLASRLRVEKWPSTLSVEFLLKSTSETDVEAAQEIAAEFDGLPLALAQAAAYITTAAQTLRGYLALYRQHHREMRGRGHAASGHSFTVATIWQLAFERLDKEAPAAVALLQLCAFLAPDGIPRDILHAGTEFLPEPLAEAVTDGLAFDDAIAALRRYSLIEVRGDSALSLHRLVQAVVRDRLQPDIRQRWAEAALQVVHRAFPSQGHDVTTWKECHRLLPHALSIVEHFEAEEIELETVAALVNRTGRYFKGRAEFTKAKAAYERALRIA